MIVIGKMIGWRLGLCFCIEVAGVRTSVQFAGSVMPPLVEGDIVTAYGDHVAHDGDGALFVATRIERRTR